MENFYIQDLSSAEHKYKHKHLCTPKTRQMKMRIGVICDGVGTFTYINQKLTVQQGDIVIIPEKIFCYSEWVGAPNIHVIYLSFKMNTASTSDGYDLQAFHAEDEAEQRALVNAIIDVHTLLQGEMQDQLIAYSKFYYLLSKLLPDMNKTRKKYKKELCEAISYITDHWNEDFLFSDVAKHCCVCETKLYRLFKEQLGESPTNYLNSIKVNYAIQYLETSRYSVSEVSQICNFHSDSYFRKVFRKYVGLNPSDYKSKFNNL